MSPDIFESSGVCDLIKTMVFYGLEGGKAVRLAVGVGASVNVGAVVAVGGTAVSVGGTVRVNGKAV